MNTSKTSNNTSEKIIYAIKYLPFYVMERANFTTGYKWEIETDKNYIKYIGENIHIINPNLLGSSSIVNFMFLPIKSVDKTEIIMKYKRPWEEDDFDIETKIITVNIK